MRLRGNKNRWYSVQAVANLECLKNEYKELITNYNGYVISSLDKIKNTNNKNIFYIIETNVYYVVTNQTLGDAMNEMFEKSKKVNE